MVNRSSALDGVFHSLADPTRRDILHRVAKSELCVGDLTKRYDMSFAAVSKHVRVLEKAGLIHKRRQGKQQLIKMAPKAVEAASEHLAKLTKIWEERFDRLEEYLKTMS